MPTAPQVATETPKSNPHTTNSPQVPTTKPQPAPVGQVLGASTASNTYVTQNQLASALANLVATFASQLTHTANPPEQVAAGGNAQVPYAAAERINQLNNVTVSGVSGLTASDVPPLSNLSGILDLSHGGTGAISASATRFNLGLSYASSTDFSNGTNIAAWGDSLTYGTGGTPYPTQLAILSGYTVYNGGVGGETSTQIKTRMLAATGKYGYAAILWVGRNNINSGIQVKADIASMVTALTTDRYFILGIINSQSEPAGSANYNTIVQLNSNLATIYGSHFIDIRSYLISQYNPGSSQDVTDHNNDVEPTSLTSDGLHLNTAGYLKVAQRIMQSISVLQGGTQSLITANNITSLLSAPPVIGSATSSAGYFSQLGIGTTSPSYLFQVSGLTTGGSVGITGFGSFGSGLVFNTQGAWIDNVGGSNQSMNFNLPIVGSSFPASFSFGFGGNSSGNGGTNVLSIIQAGNVGIGTTTPNNMLDIYSSTKAALGFNTNSGLSNWTIGQDASDAYKFKISSSTALGTNDRFVIDGSGNVGIGTTSPWAQLSISSPTGVAPLVIGTSTATNFLVDANGNVGIGTAAISQSYFRLQIKGLRTNLGVSTGGSINFFGSGSFGSAIGFTDPNAYISNSGGSNQSMVFNLPNTGASFPASYSFAFGASATNFVITNAGTNPGSVTIASANLGLGTTSPYALLSISNSVSTAANTPLFVIASTTAGTATSTPLIVLASGQVGIGTSTIATTTTFVVQGPNTANAVVAAFTNGTGTCSIDPTGTALSCSSDLRLKQNITTLTASSSLTSILALRPVSYNWLTEAPGTPTHTGFIAQEVEPLLPDLVHTDSLGMKSLNYAGFVPYLISAFQALSAKVGDFALNIVSAHVTATVGDFDTVNAKKASVEELCAKKSDGTSVCVTGDQLAAVLSNTGATSGGSSSSTTSVNSPASTTPDTTPPAIIINGNNPTTINVGDTYADLGATVTDNINHNLGIRLFLNGVLVNVISVDTTAVATDTIDYVATDAAGNTATSTRTVIVETATSTGQ